MAAETNGAAAAADAAKAEQRSTAEADITKYKVCVVRFVRFVWDEDSGESFFVTTDGHARGFNRVHLLTLTMNMRLCMCTRPLQRSSTT